MNTTIIVFLTIYLTASFIYAFIDPHGQMWGNGEESYDPSNAYDEERYKFTPWDFLTTWISSSVIMLPWMMGLLSIAKLAAKGRHYKYLQNQNEAFARYINKYLFSDLPTLKKDRWGNTDKLLTEDQVKEIVDQIEERMVQNNISFKHTLSDDFAERPKEFEKKYTFEERLRFFKRVRTNI
jgi:hypothetical protein